LAHLIGPELVPDFASGYKAFWRKNSVGIPDPERKGTPVSVFVGLAGITLEVAAGLDFATLGPDEAKQAATYALYELSSLPDWLADLMATHQTAVRETLSAAIALEWDASNRWPHIISQVPYQPVSVAAVLREKVLALLEDRQPMAPKVLHSAANAVLSSADRVTPVAQVAKNRVEELQGSGDERLKEWLRLWAHLAPMEAASWFDARTTASPGSALDLFTEVAGLLGEDFDERRSRIGGSSLMNPPALARWAALLVEKIRLDHDTKHNRIYRPQSRYHAQDFRNLCLHRLSRDPSPLARGALSEIAETPALAAYRQYARRLLGEQLQVAAEAAAPAWSEQDVLQAEQGDEKPPRSLEELFRLVRAHLEDLAEMIENDEFRYGRLFDGRTRERELQLWVASCLKRRARGLYSVVRENVVADDKEVDITAAAPGVGQVPIEIKPAKHSGPDLERGIRRQLIGRYMTQVDRRFGVFLIVRHSPKRGWKVGGGVKDLMGLVDYLREYAEGVARPLGRSVAVAAIDIEGGLKPEPK
jgi:hypothetical protein